MPHNCLRPLLFRLADKIAEMIFRLLYLPMLHHSSYDLP